MDQVPVVCIRPRCPKVWNEMINACISCSEGGEGMEMGVIWGWGGTPDLLYRVKTICTELFTKFLHVLETLGNPTSDYLHFFHRQTNATY